MKSAVLYVVVPCYNEEKVLPITSKILLDKLMELINKGKISDDSRIMFVNDGSKDGTWDVICGLSHEDAHFIGISQSRNRGHQNAVLAGLMESMEKAEITISIDADGQDDVNAMEAMIDEYYGGCEIVYGVRSDRSSDTWFKRTTAQGYYRFLNAMGVEVVYNHADYRLVSSKVLKHFADFQEVNLFLRGMFPLVGFKSTSVSYERGKRMAGKSHYPIRKMIALALDGITSLSVRPIRIIAGLGFFVSLIGFAGIIWAIIRAVTGHTIVGWTSTVCIICFLGGIQLLSLGIIGEYIGKTYLETKHRPRYIISERTENNNEQ